MEKNIHELLAKKIEQPILTEREELILTAIQNGHQSNVEAARKDFSDPHMKICPYCYQTIEEEYKLSLVNSINRLLSKDVDLHKEELMGIDFPQMSLDYNQYSYLNSNLVQKVLYQVTICNNLIKQYQVGINKKVGNKYTPIICN